LFKALFRTAASGIPGESAYIIWNDVGVGQAGLWITWRSTKAAFDSGQIWMVPSWTSEFECELLEPDRMDFKEAVEQWATAHHLNSAWVKEEVFSTLCFWLQPRCPRTMWLFRGPDPALGTPPPPRLRFDEPWSFQPWPDLRRDVLSRIATFRSEIKAYAKLTSLRPEDMPKKKADHYLWAVLFQCKKLSPKQIAADANRKPTIDESTVGKAVESLLDLIGLKKRHGMRGPKAKPKT
jgi:hypothetical protein